MMAFEKYLISEGFKMFTYKNDKFTPLERHSYSSTTNIAVHYILNDMVVSCGLHEYGKPPTLLHPRPETYIVRECDPISNTEITANQQDDDVMNYVLDNVSNKEILHRLFNDVEPLHFDLTK